LIYRKIKTSIAEEKTVGQNLTLSLAQTANHEEARICRMEGGSVLIEPENLQKQPCRSKKRVEGIYTNIYPATGLSRPVQRMS
jgi:hypothetical protein